MSESFDLVIGQKSMYELEASVDFNNLAFSFLKRSLPVYAVDNFSIRPGKTKDSVMELKNIPYKITGYKDFERKCKLFKKSLVFMGLKMMIEDGMPKMKPLKSRIEAILKVKLPTTVKECRSFCGMVNYMSIFLPSLQEKLIPIYFITRKGVPFYWGEEQQKAFDSIKQDITNAPVLLMPNTTGHFVLVSDTSKIGCGAALYQKQKGKYHLIAYYSKKLP